MGSGCSCCLNFWPSGLSTYSWPRSMHCLGSAVWSGFLLDVLEDFRTFLFSVCKAAFSWRWWHRRLKKGWCAALPIRNTRNQVHTSSNWIDCRLLLQQVQKAMLVVLLLRCVVLGFIPVRTESIAVYCCNRFKKPCWWSCSCVASFWDSVQEQLTTSKHHSSVWSPSVPEHLICLLSVAHVDLSRTKTPSAVLKTGNSCLIWARTLSSLRRLQPRTNGHADIIIFSRSLR